MTDDITRLITQWRHNAQGCGKRDAHAAGTWRSCARELEAALAQQGKAGGVAEGLIRPAGFNESARVTVMTYTEQPGNVEASRLGEARAKSAPGGDYIDGGLSLLHELHRRGYGIVRIHPLAPQPKDAT